MKILLVHQNFPAQYIHLAKHFGAATGNQVAFITQRRDASLTGVSVIPYVPKRKASAHTHHYLREVEAGVLNAQEVVRVAMSLRQSGFVPDLILGHNGWGEIWYLKDVYPAVPLIGYFEFFYRTEGADIEFDPGVSAQLDTAPRVRTKNIGNLLGLDACDMGQCPTYWQRSVYPERYHSMLRVVHEGIDTRVVAPFANAKLTLPGLPREFKAGEEILTYVARNLEPYRGFDIFMRALPRILEKRPDAHILVVGGDEVSYGRRLPPGQSYKQMLLAELGDSLDYSRVHFLGRIPYANFLQVLQVSRAHVYLTYPFVLSWSMLEAMSAGCLVIGSKTPPVEEVLRDGENGILVEFFNVGALADRVIDALANPGEYLAARERARRTIIESYDLRTIALPAQLKMIREVAEPSKAYLWRRPRG